MAQRTLEPLLTPVVPKGSVLAPLTLISIPPVPSVTPGFPPLSPRAPQHPMGHWQTHTTPDPVTDPILVTYARASEAPLTLPSLGLVTSNAHPAIATSALGSYPLEQSESSPLHLLPRWHCNSAFPLTGPLKSGTSAWRSLPRSFRAWLCLPTLLQLLLHLRSLRILFLLSRYSLLPCRPGHHPSCSLLQ